MSDRRNLDLQLLACLDALITECSVTRAAERMGIRRRLGMRVASILLTPYVVAQSPLLAILPRVFAQHFAGFLPLKIVTCEFELPPIGISMVWHERSHRLGMHTWMSGVIRDVVADHVADKLALPAASAASHAGVEAA